MEILDAVSKYVPLLQTVIWLVVIGILIKVFYEQIVSLFSAIRFRIEKGSALKIGPIELGEDLQRLPEIGKQTDAEPLSQVAGEYAHAGISSEMSPAEAAEEEARRLQEERENVYDQNHRIFLTHLIRPSEEKGQQYDIFIYLIRHGGQGFEDVEHVDFYLGPYWGNKVFRRTEVNGKIGFSTAAYGTFLCTCWVTMKDGTRIFLTRYIDFEMARVFEA